MEIKIDMYYVQYFNKRNNKSHGQSPKDNQNANYKITFKCLKNFAAVTALLRKKIERFVVRNLRMGRIMTSGTKYCFALLKIFQLFLNYY